MERWIRQGTFGGNWTGTVKECAECRRLVEAQRTVFSALDQWAAPEVSADFDKKLYARIAADKPSFWQRFLPTPIV